MKKDQKTGDRKRRRVKIVRFQTCIGCSQTLKPTGDLPNSLLSQELKREPHFKLTKLACAGGFYSLPLDVIRCHKRKEKKRIGLQRPGATYLHHPYEGKRN